MIPSDDLECEIGVQKLGVKCRKHNARSESYSQHRKRVWSEAIEVFAEMPSEVESMIECPRASSHNDEEEIRGGMLHIGERVHAECGCCVRKE